MATATDSITDPGEYVTRFIENIEQSHFTAAMEMVSEDCEYDNVPITKVFGRSAIEQTLGGFLAECSSYEWLIHHQVSSGDLEHGVVMNERTDRFEIDGRRVSCCLSYSRSGLPGALTHARNAGFRTCCAGPLHYLRCLLSQQ